MQLFTVAIEVGSDANMSWNAVADTLRKVADEVTQESYVEGVPHDIHDASGKRIGVFVLTKAD